MPDAATTVGQIGEFGLIGAVLERLRAAPGGAYVRVGPGDDAAVLAAASGTVVASTDVVVEGTHFRRAWCSGADVGHKTAAQSMADIVAMGARPTALLIGLVVPSAVPVAWVLDLADGLSAECAPLGVSVIGGDITRGEAIVVSGTALGELDGGTEPITRAGALLGDAVMVCGRLGMAAAGLAVLSRGFRSPRAAVEAYRRPQVPYAAAAEAVAAGAHAMIDVSDGLLQDVGHIAHASGVDIDLDLTAVDLPQTLRDVGAALGADPMEFLLTGGEDHALVACVAADVVLPDGWTRIGTVRTPDGDPGVVRVAGEPHPGPGGWDHFG